MIPFDGLKLMSDQERLDYLHSESERIISEASPKNRLKLQALQAKCDGIRRKYKDAYTAALYINQLMMQSMLDLDYALTQAFRAKTHEKQQKP